VLRRRHSVGLAALGLAAATLASVAAPGGAGSALATPVPHLRGLVPEPPPHKPGFTLTDTSNHPFRFAAATRGRLTYLYFGYTHCPDACPTTMADIGAALRRQPAAARRRVDVVFVTVDPGRDTERVLRRWLDHFGRSFVGLTGSKGQIRAAERSAGIPLAPPQREKGTHYAVQHSSLVLAYSPDGLAHVVYTQGFHTGDYAHDLPLLLRYQ
jgi:protein SCO1/2